jgi:UDP-N-acetyl-2-amino-2-deoxyglucuronate dehydrogenase
MINFAIIGCGRIAKRHAELCQQTGRLVAVCDIDKGKALELAATYRAKVYTDLNDLLQKENELHVVVICTPNGLHSEHTIKSIEAGFHVLCEKPMAIHTDDCREMIRVADLCKKILFIVKQNRFNPPIVAVKKVLEENKLGRIYIVQLNCYWNRTNDYYRDTWRGTANMDGGLLYTQFSHFIDQLYWMFGDVKKVNAFTANFAHRDIIEFEDAGIASMVLESGALASLHFTINSYKKNMEGSLTIIGEKGAVKIGGPYLNKLEYEEIENYRIGKLSPDKGPNDYGQYQGSMSNHDKVYSHLYQVLQNGQINDLHGYYGLKTVEIIEKIYRSANRTEHEN